MTNREWLNSLDDEVRNRMTANDNKNTTTELTDEDYFKALREKPLQKIDRIPSADVVEVVRCKDCKHRRELIGTGAYCEKTYTFMSVQYKLIDDDFYCADGERRGIE